MKIILKKEIKKLGEIGDTVNVSDGYARNYLIPTGAAWPAEEKYWKRIESLRDKVKSTELKKKEKALELAEKIETLSLTVEAEVGEEDRLFGTVTNSDISEKLKEAGVEVDKKNIKIDDPIKKLGVYKVAVSLHQNVEATCKVWVVRK